MKFTVVFHGPFRISTGGAAVGVDATLDPGDPVPATSLKGLMRASATALLSDAEVVREVFGDATTPSPWSWSGVDFGDDDVNVIRRVRATIDPESGVAVERGLMAAHEAWATAPGRFSVDLVERLDPTTLRRHEAVLAGAARAVTSLGSDRRRGLGWVTVRPDDVDDELLDEFIRLATKGPV